LECGGIISQGDVNGNGNEMRKGEFSGTENAIIFPANMGAGIEAVEIHCLKKKVDHV
jgi:hypothetical protein